MKLKKGHSSYRIWDPVVSELENNFHEGVYLSNPVKVAACIKSGVDPNATDDDNLSALHHAAVRGDLDMARVLFTAKGLNINIADPDGNTPLMFACMYGKLDFANVLLIHSANVNARNSMRQSALHLACIQNNTKLVQLLLTYGAQINKRDAFDNTPLSLAVIDRGAIPLSTLLLRHNANATSVKRFPLFLECVLNCNSLDRLQIIKILLSYGVDIHCLHPIDKRNCLHYVGITGYLPAAKSLVKHGDDNLNGRDLTGRTPLEVSWDHKNMDVFRYFQECMEQKRMAALVENDEKLFKDNDEGG